MCAQSTAWRDEAEMLEGAITRNVFSSKVFIKEALIFFPRKILKLYPCFEVSPYFYCFFFFQIEREGE